ncbi:MAG: AAA family ATPase [Bacteroidetes bacterium]|jgi:shikimate kinase|nr:AAA family ATPase [Bacteroidota bacterium]
MKIFLIGFMGSGKTTVGKKLANLLNYTFMDMDQYIEYEEGRSVSQIFELAGEDYFRQAESRALHALLQKEDIVVATGGGTPCFNNNMKLITQNSIAIYLKLSPKAFVSRVYDPNTNRPLIKGKSREELEKYAEELLSKREPYYTQAKHIVNAINEGPGEIAYKVKTLLLPHSA